MRSNSNDTEPIELERFAVILEAYGADSEAWPEDERAGALLLLEHSLEAVRLREEAAALDGWLDEMPLVEPSPALQSRILAAAPRPAQSWGDRWSRVAEAIWPFGPSWQPVTALAAAVALGFTFGFTFPEQSDEEAMVVADLLLDTGEYWNEEP